MKKLVASKTITLLAHLLSISCLAQSNMAPLTSALVSEPSNSSDKGVPRKLQSDRCYPFYLDSKTVFDQEYTITDAELEYRITPWTAYPENCIVSYDYRVTDEDGAPVEREIEQMIDLQGEYFYFRSDNTALVNKKRTRVIRITLIGSIGEDGFMSLVKEIEFTLKLWNPCYDPYIVSIGMNEAVFPAVQDYTLYKPFVKYDLPSAELEAFTYDAEELCGELSYKVIDVTTGDRLTPISQPIAFLSSKKWLMVYSEDPAQVGFKHLRYSAYFKDYLSRETESIYFSFEVKFSACPFEELTILPTPFESVKVFFLDEAVSQTYSLDNLISRLSDEDCGPIIVDFTLENGDPLPENVFALTENSLTVRSQALNGQEARGFYKIHYRVYFEEYPEIEAVYNQDEIRVHVLDPCLDQLEGQRPALCLARGSISDTTPEWLTQLSDQYIIFGQDFTYAMGEPEDNYGRLIAIDVTIQSTAQDFMSYSEIENSLKIQGANMTNEYLPVYYTSIETTFIDIFGIELHFKRDVEFHLVQIMRPEVRPMDRVLFMGEESNWILASDLEKLNEELNSQKLRPEPYFIKFGQQGKVVLGFSQLVKPIDDLESINRLTIAIEQKNIQDSEQVLERAWIINRNVEEDQVTSYGLQPAIQVIYQPWQDELSTDEQDQQARSKVEIKEIGSDQMTIEADFEAPKIVSRRDEILLRFLRNDLVVSQDDEVWIEYGQEVRIPIFLQIESDQESTLDRLARLFFALSILLSLVLTIQACFFGSIVSVWMYFNSMQLFVYLALLQVPIPTDLSTFMKGLLDRLRLRRKEYDLTIEAQEQPDFAQLALDQDSYYTPLLRVMGYSPSFFWNLAPVFYILLTMVIIYAILLLAQVIFKKKLARHDWKFSFLVPQSLNVLVRFAYLAFLEITVCTFLALSIAYSTIDVFFAVVSLLSVMTAISLVILLFWRGGPLSGEAKYEKCSLWAALFCWQVRKVVESDTKPNSMMVEGDVDRPKNDKEPHENDIPQADELQMTQDDPEALQTNRGLLTMKETAPVEAESPHKVIEETESEKKRRKELKKKERMLKKLKELNQKQAMTQNLEGGESVETQSEKVESPNKPDEEPEEMTQLQLKAIAEAKKRAELTEQLQVKPSYKTLFLGLKIGHPDQVAVIQPLVYMIRRVILAYSVIIVQQNGVASLCVLQLFCVLSLCQIAVYKQWEDNLINLQHFVNEVLLYFFMSFLLAITALPEIEWQNSLGTFLKVLLVLTLLFNLFVLTYQIIYNSKLLLQKYTKTKKPWLIAYQAIVKKCGIKCMKGKRKSKKKEQKAQRKKRNNSEDFDGASQHRKIELNAKPNNVLDDVIKEEREVSIESAERKDFITIAEQSIARINEKDPKYMTEQKETSGLMQPENEESPPIHNEQVKDKESLSPGRRSPLVSDFVQEEDAPTKEAILKLQSVSPHVTNMLVMEEEPEIANQDRDGPLEGATLTKIHLETNNDFKAKEEGDKRYESPRESFYKVQDFDPDQLMEKSPAPPSKPVFADQKNDEEQKSQLTQPAVFQIMKPLDFVDSQRNDKLKAGQSFNVNPQPGQDRAIFKEDSYPMTVEEIPPEEIVVFNDSPQKLQTSVAGTEDDQSPSRDAHMNENQSVNDYQTVQSKPTIHFNNMTALSNKVGSVYGTVQATPEQLNDNIMFNSAKADSEKPNPNARDSTKLDDLKMAMKFDRNQFNHNFQTNHPSPKAAFNIVSEPKFMKDALREGKRTVEQTEVKRSLNALKVQEPDQDGTNSYPLESVGRKEKRETSIVQPIGRQSRLNPIVPNVDLKPITRQDSNNEKASEYMPTIHMHKRHGSELALAKGLPDLIMRGLQSDFKMKRDGSSVIHNQVPLSIDPTRYSYANASEKFKQEKKWTQKGMLSSFEEYTSAYDEFKRFQGPAPSSIDSEYGARKDFMQVDGDQASSKHSEDLAKKLTAEGKSLALAGLKSIQTFRSASNSSDGNEIGSHWKP